MLLSFIDALGELVDLYVVVSDREGQLPLSGGKRHVREFLENALDPRFPLLDRSGQVGERKFEPFGLDAVLGKVDPEAVSLERLFVEIDIGPDKKLGAGTL